MKTMASLGLLGAALAASPTPTQSEVMNFRFNAQEAGCMTRALKAMDNRTVQVLPDPKAPGTGAILRINRPALQHLVKELGVTNKVCLAQLRYLLTPATAETQTVDVVLRWNSPAEYLRSLFSR